jgi:uncharacterized repeat protein (TIGR03806 family)
MRFCLAFLTAAAITAALLAQEKKDPPTFECRRATGPIEIDGKADEAAWQQAESIDKFGQSWLKENAKPPKTATKARLLWDRDNLYFFAELEDHDLFGDIVEHDGRTWLNDVFEMFFRPDENKPAYYEFQINAAGTMLDIYFQRKGIPFDQAKIDGEFKWKSAVVRRGSLDNRTDRDEGWTVEGRIPWDDFSRTGGRPAEGDVWRFALCRYDYTLNEKPELSSSAPLTQPSFHQLEDYARLKFVGMKAGSLRPGIPTQSHVATSKVIGSPDPPLPYRPVRAFPNLKLTFPISLDLIPGTNQFLVIAQDKPYGPSVIFRFADDPAVSEPEKLLTTPVNGTAYGICFHPRFADNGYLYIGWNGTLADPNQSEASAKDQPRGGSKRTYATRYTMDRQTLTIDPDSALHVISWESNGHNGGDLEFGRDGMLYITSGDGTSDSDTNLRGQDLTQMTSKVLRIDVDHPADGKNYSVPRDNPFVGQEGVVPETWAYGLRNPWRLTVDPKTGHIWVGNNGQDLWEQVYFVRKGDNFGWSVYEGSHVFYANRTMGPQPLTPPVAEHHHSEARSMTGGVVYYGSKLPELYGAYIYGDHSTGRIWGIRHDGTRVTWHKLLVDTTFNITGFAIDSNGDLLVADHRGNGEGAYYYLESTPPQTTPSTFPRKLSESGLFASVKQHAMQPGVVPYSVNSPLWSDGAHKERYFAIPESASSDFKIDLSKRNGWDFPDETVLVKSFALEQTEGEESSRRWIETRFLTKQDGEWAGYSYIWNDDQTDAELVAAEGLDRDYKLRVPVSSEHPDGIKTQKWHYPSRVECMVCHSRAANFVLGLSTAQMNKEHDYGGAVEHQFRVLEQLDLVKTRGGKQASAVDPSKLAKLANPYDENEPLEARARSYLHANCSICHMQAGGGNAQMDLEFSAATRKFNVIDVPPLHHKFGIEDARLIAPGHPERSVLLYRMAHRGEGSGQMPQLATSLIDERAVKLFEAWIRNMQPEN